MKKDYVNLKVQVVEVQLSDCIAGSVGPQVKEGTMEVDEVNGRAMFSAW